MIQNKNQEKLIKNICIYLKFIKKEPFHPPNLKINNEKIIYGKNNKYYCKIKEKHENDKNSLCKNCQADTISKKRH